MITRVLDSAYITDFINDKFNGEEIRNVIKRKADQFAKQVTDEKLIDWEICFRFRYNHTKVILIYLKGKSYPKEKYKEITIHIPIPVKEKASWGVNLEQFVYEDENHLDSLSKNFCSLNVDYSQFTNRQNYILDCMYRAVKFCFENGFTINGVKVKIPSYS